MRPLGIHLTERVQDLTEITITARGSLNPSRHRVVDSTAIASDQVQSQRSAGEHASRILCGIHWPLPSVHPVARVCRHSPEDP